MKLESTLKTRSGLFHIAPILDVVLILLIFFLLGSSFMVRSGVTVSLPESSSTLEGLAGARVITISAGTPPTILLDGSRVSISDLEEAFAAKGKENGLIIRADELATHGLVMQVANIAMAAGYKLAFATAPPGLD